MQNFFGNRPGFIFIPIFAVTYNCILAVMNALGVPVSFAIAAFCEILIILCAFTLIVNSGFKQTDATFLLFVGAFVVLSLYLTVLNGKVLIDGLRNFLIISSFALLGMRMSFEELNKYLTIQNR